MSKIRISLTDIIQKDSNKSWCPVPWTTVSTSNDGHYRLCVQANTHRETRGRLLDSAGNTIRADETRVKDMRNGSVINEVRSYMLQGLRHPLCERCNREDDSGFHSRRAHARGHWINNLDRTYNEFKDNTRANGEINHDDFPILEADIRLGNRCNLKCRSCYPGESSGWYEEWFETRSNKFSDSEFQIYLKRSKKGNVLAINDHKMKWYEDSKLFKYSHEDLEQCEQFHIVGGEPLLIEEHYDVLTKFVESGRAKNVSLDYNSNLTHVPTRVIKLWENFKEVKIGVSIDGLGPVNDYIRYPSKWENVEKNLQKVANSKVPLLMWITLTVMVYNIFEIPKLLKWQIQHGGKYFSQLDWLLFLVPHPLHNPVHLSAAVLPKEVKNQVRSVYHDFQHGWFEDYLSNSDLDEESRQRYRERMANIIENIIACMDQRDNVQYLDDFFKYTDSMDRYRDQSFEESLPMLYNALSPYRKL